MTTDAITKTIEAEVKCTRCTKANWVGWDDRHSAYCRSCGSSGPKVTRYTGRTRYLT
jgi:Zn finger protein HypA/HybF involved in hydrogenase expression